jgi:hypothetical protein
MTRNRADTRGSVNSVYIRSTYAFQFTFLILKKYREAYEITLLSVYLCVPLFFFYAVRFVLKELQNFNLYHPYKLVGTSVVTSK